MDADMVAWFSFNGHGVVAAVDEDFGAGDEFAGIACHEQRRADEFAGFAKAFHRGMGHDGLDAVGREHFAVLLGGEKAGHEDVDAHVLHRPFAREIFREVVDGGFRGRIGEHARERRQAGCRADVDNRAALTALDQVFSENLAGEEDAFQVDAHDAVILVLGDVEEGGCGIGAGAVDEDVDFTGAREHGGEEVLERGFAGGVGGEEIAFAAGARDFVEARPGFFLVAAHEHDFGARAREAFGHRAAQFARAAEDDGDFSVKVED